MIQLKINQAYRSLDHKIFKINNSSVDENIHPCKNDTTKLKSNRMETHLKDELQRNIVKVLNQNNNSLSTK
jgi:hypothetical protein